MNSEDAFLADIREHPEDNSVRLVFADWLEDNGDPDRAEFVRLQVRLEQTPEHDPARFALEESSRDLLAEHQSRWLPHLPKWARELELTFRRGLPEVAKMSQPGWLKHGMRLASLVPLQRVEIGASGPASQAGAVARQVSEAGLTELRCPLPFNYMEATDLFASLRSTRLRQLGFGFDTRDVGLVDLLSSWSGLSRLTGLELPGPPCRLLSLLASPNLGSLKRLEVSRTRNVSEGWTTLAANERLTGLRRLTLGGQAGPPGMLQALTDAHWPHLEGFRLLTAPASADELQNLLAAPWSGGLRSLELNLGADPFFAWALWQARLPRLEALTLNTRRFDPDQAANLGACELLSGLTSLTIRLIEQAEGLARTLAKARLSRLHRLNLFGEQIAAGDLGALVDSAQLGSLRELFVWRPSNRSGLGLALAHCSGLARLRVLTLAGAPLDDEDFAALTRSPHIADLARLSLRFTALNNDRLAVLLSATWLPSVRELCLSHNVQITDGGAEALAACPALSRLRLLDLCHTGISNAGAAALADSPHLNRLTRLVLSASRINRTTQDRLRERFGAALVLESLLNPGQSP